MATIVDVARRAAVTPATVSNVITGRVPVSEKTRTRVLAAIEELGYRPNLVARGLVKQRTYTLGLVLYSIASPIYPEIAEEVEGVVNQHGYQLLLCNTRDNQEQGRRRLEDLVDRKVDGLLIMGGSVQLNDAVEIAQRGLSIVLCMWDEDIPTMPLSTVNVDFRYGAELAALHLLELGHRRIALMYHHSHKRHIESFRRTVTEVGVPFSDENLFHGNANIQDGYEAAKMIFESNLHPTAIYATNDTMALGAIEAAIDRGLRVPQDVSVIGMDDIMLSAHVRPSLSTIALPKREIATEATELLLRHIERPLQHPYLLTVRPRLIARQSTAPIIA